MIIQLAFKSHFIHVIKLINNQVHITIGLPKLPNIDLIITKTSISQHCQLVPIPLLKIVIPLGGVAILLLIQTIRLKQIEI